MQEKIVLITCGVMQLLSKECTNTKQLESSIKYVGGD